MLIVILSQFGKLYNQIYQDKSRSIIQLKNINFNFKVKIYSISSIFILI